MLFKLVLEEQFTSKYNRDAHYEKHVVKGKQFKCSVEEYEIRADELSRKKIDNKNIFGYQSITRDNRVANCKYDKSTEEFVVYRIRNGEPETITMYRKSWRDYYTDRAIEYYDEIVE